MSQRDEYVQRMKNQLDDWNADIDQLEKRVQSFSADAKAKYQKQLNETRKRQRALEQRIDELRTAGEGAWEDLRGQVEHAWKAFEHSVNYFKSQFK